MEILSSVAPWQVFWHFSTLNSVDRNVEKESLYKYINLKIIVKKTDLCFEEKNESFL